MEVSNLSLVGRSALARVPFTAVAFLGGLFVAACESDRGAVTLDGGSTAVSAQGSSSADSLEAGATPNGDPQTMPTNDGGMLTSSSGASAESSAAASEGSNTSPSASTSVSVGVGSSASSTQAPAASSAIPMVWDHVDLGPFVPTNNAAQVSGSAVGAAVSDPELLRKRVEVLGAAPEPLLFGDAYVLRASETDERATFILPVKNTGADTLCLMSFDGVQYLDSAGLSLAIANSASVRLHGSTAPGSAESDYFNDCLAPGESAYATTHLGEPTAGTDGTLYSQVASVTLTVTLSEFSFVPASESVEPDQYTYVGSGQLALRVTNTGLSDVGLESALPYFVLDEAGAPLAAGQAQLLCPGVLAPGESAWAVEDNVAYQGSGVAGRLWVVAPFNQVSGLSDPSRDAAACSVDTRPLTIAREGAVPGGLTVAGSDVYFTLPDAGQVRRVSTAGGVSVIVAEDQLPNGPILANATHVYWTNRDQGTLAYVPIAGGVVQNLFPAQGEPYNLALTQTQVYWSNSSGEPGIFTTLLTGGSPFRTADVSYAHDIAVDETHLYWIDRGNVPTLYRLTFAGGERDLLANGDPIDLVLFNGDIYWVEKGSIYRIAAGSDTSELLIHTNGVEALAIDDSGAYWFDGNDLVRMRLDGSTTTELVSSGEAGSGIALDATHVYWTNSAELSVKAVTKP